MIFLSQKPTILIGKEVIGDGHDLDFIEINNPSGQSLSLAFGPNRTGMGIRIVVSSFGIGHFMATRLPPKPFVWNRLFVGNDLVSCTIWIYFGIPATPHRRARARNPGPYGDAVGCQHPFSIIFATGVTWTGAAPQPNLSPVGTAMIVGAFLFGIGMQLGGACASGTLFMLLEDDPPCC